LPTVVVVGGGIAGLTTAYCLVRDNRQLKVIVLEAAPTAGGVIATSRDAGRLVELGPNGFLDSKPAIVGLCEELRLPLERARPESAERFVLVGGKLRRAPKTPGEFLRSDMLSLGGKLRFLWERLGGRVLSAEDESIADFGRRHFGKEATATLVDAVVTGIYAGDIEKLSVKSCFPKLVELESQYGSLLKAQSALATAGRKAGQKSGALGTLACPRGGMGRLVEGLTKSIGDRVEYRTSVERVRLSREGWSLDAGGRAMSADAVVLAAPADAAARSLRGEDETIAAELAGIQSAPAAVVAMSFKRAVLPTMPIGFGYLAPERLGRPVLGVIYSSNVFEAQAPDDEFMFRAILGGDRRRDVIEWSDEQLVQTVRDDLREFLGITAEPVFRLLQRWRQAIPQYHVEHAARLARIDERLRVLPGVFLTGASYRGVAVADCVKDGMAVADQVAQYLESTGSKRG